MCQGHRSQFEEIHTEQMCYNLSIKKQQNNNSDWNMLNKIPTNPCDTQAGESKKRNNWLLLEGTIILTLHFKNWFYTGGFIKTIQYLQTLDMYFKI